MIISFFDALRQSMKEFTMQENIVIRGVRQNNLKGLPLLCCCQR